MEQKGSYVPEVFPSSHNCLSYSSFNLIPAFPSQLREDSSEFPSAAARSVILTQLFRKEKL